MKIYNGRLDTNALLYWIFEMGKLFEFEGTFNNRKVKIVVNKLKGHASLWWENFQIDRQRKGMNKFKKFHLANYYVNILMKMQNLR